MSQDKTDLPGNEPNPAATETPEAVASEAEVQVAEAAEDAAVEGEVMDNVDDVETLRAALVHKAEEADKYHDQALRAAAETDNVRKRAQRDVEAARKFALEKFASELLGVRDSLDMGLQAADATGAELGQVREGMELTGRMLASAMEKFGVEVVNPQGETFDPEKHEAVSMQETDEHAANSVVAVVQKGYTLNGRVLRAAMVVVARAPGA